MNILVVDDDDSVSRWVSRVLQNCGHTVQTAADGRRAIEVLARDRVDLLISDIAMPTMRGPELAAAARRLQPALPILLMSGSEQCDGYPVLAKPFRAQHLLVAVRQAMVAGPDEVRVRPGRSRAEGELASGPSPALGHTTQVRG